jgi:hypothetical protein
VKELHPGVFRQLFWHSENVGRVLLAKTVPQKDVNGTLQNPEEFLRRFFNFFTLFVSHKAQKV